jgi:hypothetical protein
MRKHLVLGFVILLAGVVAANGAASAATLSGAAPGPAFAAPPTFGFAGDAALTTLERTLYLAPGRWNMCVPNECGSADHDWGADSLTYTLFLRWKVAHDASIVPIMSALGATAREYGPCRLGSCRYWSDVPMWDSIAATREFEIARNPAMLRKAVHAFEVVDRSNAFALGACPTIDFQRAAGGETGLKTLETDSNYIKAALLLLRWTGDRRYLQKAIVKYAAVRRYFLDPALALYTVYVFDDGRSCAQLPHRFFASVNGNMIYNGLTLAQYTRRQGYLRDATATAQAVARELSDAAGFFADLQAENDVPEPLVEAMYDLAKERGTAFARKWLLANASVAAPAPSGTYGRFFDGPPPAATVSAWSANGGLALAIAAGALDRTGVNADPRLWQGAGFVADPIDTVPATIAFTGRAIALIGTIGDICCEPGHVRVFIDGSETVNGTGIWQNKSSSYQALPKSVLLSWRWPSAGQHTITLKPARFNAKEGGTYIHLQGYEFVP